MANRHFAKLADVWKHLVLAEVLSIDRPRNFCDTHAGHAVYAMTSDAERRYGVVGFMEVAADDDVLGRSAYFRILQQHATHSASSEYPAGPMLTMLALGETCSYLFCDRDPESCENILENAAALGLESHVRVVEGDGMVAVHNALADGVGKGPDFVYTDPFDHLAVGAAGLSALDVAQEAAQQEIRVVYWYGYDHADQRAWILDALRTRAPAVDWWCGDVMITAPDADMHNGDLGDATSPGTGFGLVCANVSPAAIDSCVGLGHALSRAYQGRALPDGRSGNLHFETPTRGSA